MYRHDGSRSAATDAKTGSQLKESWVAELGEPITATTVGWGKVFFAGLRTHRVMALDSRDGQIAWSVDVDNRVDTPPTLWQGKVYCGTAGGYVYCLRADDGEFVWRFNANPAHRSIVAFGNIESAWPVHGSVTVADGVVYFAAGRTTYLDGGLRFYGLDAETGRPRHFETRDTVDRRSFFDTPQARPFCGAGAEGEQASRYGKSEEESPLISVDYSRCRRRRTGHRLRHLCKSHGLIR
jgi:outer membrane protein assembly factor BamB